MALAGSGCGAFDSDVAATVDGVNITWAQVEALATDGKGFVGSTTDSGPLRRQLPPLFVFAVMKAELERRGSPVTDSERSQAVQQAQQLDEGFGDRPQIAKDFEVDLVATMTKLNGLIAGIDPTSVDQQRSILDRLPALRDAWCFEQVSGVAELGDGLEAAMRAGEPIDGIVSSLDPAKGGGGAGCISDVQRRALTADTSILDEPAGTVLRQDTTSQGQAVVQIIRNVGRTRVEPGTPQAEQMVTGFQQQQASAARQNQSPWAELALTTAKVHVDSRLGTWDGTQVVPPATPLDRDPAPVAPSLPGGPTPGG